MTDWANCWDKAHDYTRVHDKIALQHPLDSMFSRSYMPEAGESVHPYEERTVALAREWALKNQAVKITGMSQRCLHGFSQGKWCHCGMFPYPRIEEFQKVTWWVTYPDVECVDSHPDVFMFAQPEERYHDESEFSKDLRNALKYWGLRAKIIPGFIPMDEDPLPGIYITSDTATWPLERTAITMLRSFANKNGGDDLTWEQQCTRISHRGITY